MLFWARHPPVWFMGCWKLPGLGCLHINEPGLFSYTNGKAALIPGKLKLQHFLSTTQRGMNSPGKRGTEFCTSTGERQRHTEPLSHPTTTVRPAPDETTLTGCVSSEAPRNHPLLPHILVKLDVPVADGEQEPGLWRHDEKRGHKQHFSPLLAREELLQFPVFMDVEGFICRKSLTFPLLYHICVCKRMNSSVIHESPRSTRVFHSQCGLCEHTEAPAALSSTLQEAGSGSPSFSGCTSQKTCSLC